MKKSTELLTLNTSGNDEKPIMSEISSRQIATFEELLDHELQLEKISANSDQINPLPVKRKFLRKGEGLARFQSKLKTSVSAPESRKIIDDCKVSIGNNKEKLVQRVVSRKFSQVDTGTINHHESAEKLQDFNKLSPEPRVVRKKVTGSIDESFKRNMKEWESRQKEELAELYEFEMLEEVADNFSFSSISSGGLIVNKVKVPYIQSEVNEGNEMKQESSEYENDLDNTLTHHSSEDLENSGNILVLKPIYEQSVDDHQQNNESNEIIEVDLSQLSSEDERNCVNAKQHEGEFSDEDSWKDESRKESDLDESIIASHFASTPSTSDKKQSVERKDSEKTSYLSLTSQMVSLTESGKHITDEIAVEQMVNEQNTNGYFSFHLQDKLAELDREIQHFRQENNALAQLKKERENALKLFLHEKSDFEKQKYEELQKLEKFKEEGMKKLRLERSLFEKYQKVVQSMPDKKERTEIDTLKAEISKLQNDFKCKESKWSFTSARLRDRIQILEKENAQQKEQILNLEKAKTEQWKTNIRSANIKPGRKCFFNNLANFPKMNSMRINTSSLPAFYNPESGGHPLNLIEKTNFSSNQKLPSYNKDFLLDKVNKETTGSKPSENSESSSYDSYFNIISPTSLIKKNEEFKENCYQDGKIERSYKNGSREVVYNNGSRKEISADQKQIKIYFFNGDIKEIFADGREIYFYAETKTIHTTYQDGLSIFHFPNNQVEKHYSDGGREIFFSDKTVKYIYPDGSEKNTLLDGTVIHIATNGDKTVEFIDGQREIYSSDFKKREYLDGTTKTIYNNGRQETCYSSGRIRVKDKDGNIIVDQNIKVS